MALHKLISELLPYEPNDNRRPQSAGLDEDCCFLHVLGMEFFTPLKKGPVRR